MSKFTVLTVAFSLSFSAATASAGGLSDRAQEIAKRLKNMEQKLSRQEIRMIGSSLQQIEDIIGSGSGGGSSGDIVCISNGQSGGFEKWSLHDLRANRTIGGGTDKATCDRLVSAENNGLVCVSNGQSGGFEKFSVYDFETARTLGGGTNLNTCLTTVERSSSNLVCVSNGQSGGFEKFSLVNRITGQTLGGGSDLNSCLSSVR